MTPENETEATPIGVWMSVAYASCDDCGQEYGSKNAMGLMARHCKKYKHDGQVSMVYAIHYKEE